jgi:hypothetical protein
VQKTSSQGRKLPTAGNEDFIPVNVSGLTIRNPNGFDHDLGEICVVDSKWLLRWQNKEIEARAFLVLLGRWRNLFWHAFQNLKGNGQASLTYIVSCEKIVTQEQATVHHYY